MSDSIFERVREMEATLEMEHEVAEVDFKSPALMEYAKGRVSGFRYLRKAVMPVLEQLREDNQKLREEISNFDMAHEDFMKFRDQAEFLPEEIRLLKLEVARLQRDNVELEDINRLNRQLLVRHGLHQIKDTLARYEKALWEIVNNRRYVSDAYIAIASRALSGGLVTLGTGDKSESKAD